MSIRVHRARTRRNTRRALLGIALVALTVALTVALSACSPQPVASTSRCTTNALVLDCPRNTATLYPQGIARNVLWQTPRGNAPAEGWPVVIMFQGTGATPVLTWVANPLEPFGAYAQTQTVQRLLDNGFAVLTPATHLGGVTFWDTNNPLVSNYEASNDHAFMLAIFDAIDAGTFGDLDGDSLFAAGISSGGYMTSRMAVSYPGKFTALAIAAGSYATCVGPICDPGPVNGDHPPTLFLHGALDPVVPLFTMDAYLEKLQWAGVPTRRVVEPFALHRWIDASPNEVLFWFLQHRSD